MDAASENEEWIKKYEEECGTHEELSILKDFDKSPTGGFSLFPYNMNVIKSYVNNNFKTDNTFRFISRDVIFHLINEPLNKAKSDFLNKNFPSETFIKKPNLSPQTENQMNYLTSLKMKN